jgi:hypothetical protein
MIRRLFALGTFIALLGLAVAPSVASATAPESQFTRTRQAGAAWFFTSAAGRQETVQLYCGTNHAKNRSGFWDYSSKTDGLTMFIEEQSPSYYMVMTGTVERLDPQMDANLTQATVQTPVQLLVQEWDRAPYDESGNPVPPTREYTTTAYVDLTWTGVGEVQTFNGADIWKMPIEGTNRPGYVQNTRGHGSFRDAITAGSVALADGTIRVEGAADWASLVDEVSGSHLTYTGPAQF